MNPEGAQNFRAATAELAESIYAKHRNQNVEMPVTDKTLDSPTPHLLTLIVATGMNRCEKNGETFMKHSPDNWNRLAYSHWEKRLRPITTALLKNQPPVIVEIDGWTFKAVKHSRSIILRPGPAWYAHIRATKENEHAIECDRDYMIEAFIAKNRKALQLACEV